MQLVIQRNSICATSLTIPEKMVCEQKLVLVLLAMLLPCSSVEALLEEAEGSGSLPPFLIMHGGLPVWGHPMHKAGKP